MKYRISKKNKVLKGTVQLTPSKSISNRLLIIRALCNTPFEIENLASANDSFLLQKLLASSEKNLNAEDAGTAFRFLTAYLAQKPGEWTLTGSERMKQRPVGILVEALKKLGAEISYADKKNFPPVSIKGKKLKGGEIDIDGSVSSQFISGLLMIAPTLERGLKLKISGEISSQSYIDMTLKLLRLFGVRHEQKGKMISVAKQNYLGKNIFVESDWSAASYWYEMAALSDDVDLVLNGLQKDSIQGDAVIAEIMKRFGVETEFSGNAVRLTKKFPLSFDKFSYNFLASPDLVPAVAVTCAVLGVPAELKGVQNLRIKETDRLVALRTELNKMEVPSLISNFGFQISDAHGLKFPSSTFQTYNDHRMAMSFAPLALRFSEVEIENPEVVKKSYLEFWDDMKSVGFEIKEL